MKCLTICQPFAELIARGEKRVENRTWKTSYRGPLLIHAGKSRKWLTHEWAGDAQAIPTLVFGAIVGVARLERCLSIREIRHLHRDSPDAWLSHHPHCKGPWCWVLSGAKRLSDPIPYRGQLGLFEVPKSVLAVSRR